MAGRDIKGRDKQTTDCRSYVERRSGTYVHTYEEPNTSAYKRRAVRQPDGPHSGPRGAPGLRGRTR
jgi:hypothetical protein